MSDIGNTTVHAIGLGTEANLDGAILSDLAQSTGGAYTRAGDGLDLKKFFALAFGDIFEAGTLTDPTFELPRDQRESEPVEFAVCDEERITVVVGWDRADGDLEIVLAAPDGTEITGSTPGVESSTGRTWSFLKVPLPHAGQRAGLWSVRFRRPAVGGEFPPPPVPLRYFMNVIAAGGPVMTPVRATRHYHTGDVFTPLVRLAYRDGQDVHDASVRLSVTSPDTGAGTVLTRTGLRAPAEVDGDMLPAKQATLVAVEAEQGKPLFNYTERWFDLNRDRELTGAFEHVGPWGRRLTDLLRVPGNHTLRAVGTYGHDCAGMREATWSIHVGVGIDEDATDITTSVIGTGPGGTVRVRVTLFPRDRYGNPLGPGGTLDFDIAGVPGSTPQGPVTDNWDGSYTVEVLHDPGSGRGPGVSVTQPGRPSVCLEEEDDVPELPLPGIGRFAWYWIVIAILVVIILILILA